MVNHRFQKSIFKTERLLLRPLTYEDAEAIFEIRAPRETYQWTMAGQWSDKSIADEWTKDQLDKGESYQFVVELLSQDPSKPKVIGSLGMWSWTHEGTLHENEIGYMFRPAAQGHGYATEALKCFIEKVWEYLPEAKSLMGFVDAGNEGSLKVMKKCGFVQVKTETYDNVTLGKRVGVTLKCFRPGSKEDEEGPKDEERKES